MYNLMCKYEMEMSLKICDYNLITVQNVLEAVSMLKGVKSSLFIIPPHTHNFSTTGLTCINRFNYKLKMSNFLCSLNYRALIWMQIYKRTLLAHL